MKRGGKLSVDPCCKSTDLSMQMGGYGASGSRVAIQFKTVYKLVDLLSDGHFF